MGDIKKIDVFTHPSEITETRSCRCYVCVTPAVYDLLRCSAKERGFKSVPQMLYNAILSDIYNYLNEIDRENGV